MNAQLIQIANTLPTITELRDYLKGMVEGYLECALFTEEQDDKGFDDISIESKKQAITDCANFLTKADNKTHKMQAGQMGHDFWLTRNHHGTGFWDRDSLTTEQGEFFTQIAHTFKEVNLIEGDDCLLHIE